MQKTAIKIKEKEFKAVEFMREVREKLSAQYQVDRQKYLEKAKEAMETFKLRQAKAGR